MNHVSSKWLRKLRWLFLLYCLHFVGIYLYIGLRYHEWGGTKTFPAIVVVLVGLQLVYELYASLRLVKRSAFVATGVTALLIVIETGIVFNPTGVYYSPYVIAFVVLSFAIGALGWIWPLVQLAVLWLFYLFGLAGFLTTPISATKTFKLAGLGELVGITALSIAEYWFWKPRYDLSENAQLSRLDRLLKNRQQQSLIIIESISDGVIVFDTKWAISLFNPAAGAITGWTVKDAIGLDIHNVVRLSGVDGKPLPTGVDLFANALSEALDNKQHGAQKVQITGRDNKQTVVSLAVSPVIIPPNNAVVGGVAILRDITKDEQTEQQRTEFISTASHEMRTPVAAIEGYLALALNDKVSTIDERARGYLDKAHQSTQHLGKLFQDLLTSAKAEDGRLTSHPTTVEIGEFLDQLTGDLKFSAQKKNLGMEFVVNSSDVIDASHDSSNLHAVRPLYYVNADSDRLREVITNLFDNAVKYTDEGKIIIGLTGDVKNVQIYIKDTGQGIPEEDIPHLFQKFYRVDNSATRTIGGTGLGLFICRKIVELYGGRIWVESKPGSGSTFFINLPRIDTKRAEQLKASSTSVEKAAAGVLATS